MKAKKKAPRKASQPAAPKTQPGLSNDYISTVEQIHDIADKYGGRWSVYENAATGKVTASHEYISPQTVTEEPTVTPTKKENSRPFTTDFSVAADGGYTFTFNFHGFTE